jgi:F-type H+-transporting ATPase subunit alpha
MDQQPDFDDLQDGIFMPLADALAQIAPALEMAEIAHILSVGSGVAEVAGFTDLHADELLIFAGGVMGIASNLGTDRAGVIVLGATDNLRPGDPVRRTGRVVDVAVGEGLIGRVGFIGQETITLLVNRIKQPKPLTNSSQYIVK